MILLLAYLAGPLAAHIPFSAEYRLAERFSPKLGEAEPMQRYLQQLADTLAVAEQLPPGVKIHVHYVDDKTVNAFATLGGHVILFSGLLKRMPNENALAMVMAHEIAHVKHRDPIRSLGRGVAIAAILGLVDSSIGTDLASKALGQAGLLAELSYSREQEKEADLAGIDALAARYGGIQGADDMFHALEQIEHGHAPRAAEFYRSHPDVEARLQALHARALEKGWQPGRPTPLPEDFSAWLRAGGSKAEQ